VRPIRLRARTRRRSEGCRRGVLERTVLRCHHFSPFLECPFLSGLARGLASGRIEGLAGKPFEPGTVLQGQRTPTRSRNRGAEAKGIEKRATRDHVRRPARVSSGPKPRAPCFGPASEGSLVRSRCIYKTQLKSIKSLIGILLRGIRTFETSGAGPVQETVQRAFSRKRDRAPARTIIKGLR